jgi:hypothetical protein
MRLAMVGIMDASRYGKGQPEWLALLFHCSYNK